MSVEAAPGARIFGRRAAVALAGAAFLAPAAARAQDFAPPPQPIAPDAALRRLLEGNRRYATNDIETFDEDARILRDGTVTRQRVFAAVLACTDLAVPVDLIFDQPIGSVRTAKTPGNVVSSDAVASLEYAVSGLGAAVVMVLSHSGCATIAAAIKARPVLGKPGPYAAFARAIYEARGNPVFTARINALAQVARLLQISTMMAGRVQDNTLAVVGGYFDAATGLVGTAS